MDIHHSEAIPDTAQALFMDLTYDHGNPGTVEKKTEQDTLPSAALVFMAACVVGSKCGYDELVPHRLHQRLVSGQRCLWIR